MRKTDENHRPNKIGEDRKPKHGLVSKNIVGRRGGVSVHDQFVRNIDEAERAGDYHREINGAGDARGFLRVGCMVSSPLLGVGVQIDQSGPR